MPKEYSSHCYRGKIVFHNCCCILGSDSTVAPTIVPTSEVPTTSLLPTTPTPPCKFRLDDLDVQAVHAGSQYSNTKSIITNL